MVSAGVFCGAARMGLLRLLGSYRARVSHVVWACPKLHLEPAVFDDAIHPSRLAAGQEVGHRPAVMSIPDKAGPGGRLGADALRGTTRELRLHFITVVLKDASDLYPTTSGQTWDFK